METPRDEDDERLPYRITLQPMTKTIVTTTTTETTHAFPPLHFSRPDRPRSLDRKSYPLIDSGIPAEVRNFQLGIGGILATASTDSQAGSISISATQHTVNDIHNSVQVAPPTCPLEPATSTVSPLQTKKRYREDTPISRQFPSPLLPHHVELEAAKTLGTRKRQRGTSVHQIETSSSRSKDDLEHGALDPSNSAALDPQEQAQTHAESIIFAQSESSSSSPLLRDLNEASSPPFNPNVPLPSPRQSPIPADDDEEMRTLLLKDPAKGPAEENGRTPSQDPRMLKDGNMALSVLLSLPGLLADFDCLPPSTKNYCLYEILRRCEVSNLRFASQFLEPALKRDFINELPYEIALKILRELDFLSLCRAAQVSHSWRALVDSDVLIWRERLVEDGFDYVVNPLIAAAKEDEDAVKALWNLVERVAPSMTPSVKSLAHHSNNPTPHLPGHSRLLSQESPSAKFIQHHPSSLDIAKGADAASLNSIQQRLMPISSGPSRVNTQPYPDPSKISTEISHANLDTPTSMQQARKSPLHLIENPFKNAYKREFISERSWYSEDPKVVSFQGVGTRVITCLQFDNDKIIAGSEDKTIKVYDTQTGRLWKNLEGHDGGVWALQYIGNTLVSGSTDRTVKIWNIREGRCTHTFTGHTSTVRCLQIILPAHSEPILSADSSFLGNEYKSERKPAWPVIVTGSRDATLRVWRLPISGFDREWHPDLVSNADDVALPVGKNPYFVHLLNGHDQSVRALSGHGSLLASGSYDQSVKVWDITSGSMKFNLTGHEEKVYTVLMDPVRNQVISGSLDSRVRIWSLETGACLHELRGHTSLVGLLDLSHSHLVSAAADGTLRVWNPESGHCIHILKAHQGAITCFQHSETKIISGSDGTLKLWDLRTGEPIRDLLKDLSAVWQVRFDDRRCVAAVERNGMTWFEVLDFGDPDEIDSRRFESSNDTVIDT